MSAGRRDLDTPSFANFLRFLFAQIAITKRGCHMQLKRTERNSFLYNKKYHHHQNYRENMFTWNDMKHKCYLSSLKKFLHFLYLIRMSHFKNQCFSNAFPTAVMTLKRHLLYSKLLPMTTIISPFYSSIAYSHKALSHKSWAAL